MADKAAFWKKLDTLRGQSKRPSLADVTALGIDCKLRARETLREVKRYIEGGRQSSDISYAIEEFVATLCSKKLGARSIEYTSSPSVLTASLFEQSGRKECQIIVPNAELAEVMNQLFCDEATFRSVDEVGLQSVFDIAVCQAPLGYRSRKEQADGFGGEIVSSLAPLVSKTGILIWITARDVTSSASAKFTFDKLGDKGLCTIAVIDIPSGGFPGTAVKGSLIILGRGQPSKKFVGVFRDPVLAPEMAIALLKGPTKHAGPCWDWVNADDTRIYGEIEQAKLLNKLAPRGPYEDVKLGSLMVDEAVTKADKPIPEKSEATRFLYFPEYAGSRVTIDEDESTVKARALYRIPVDTSKANARFLAALLNGPFGRTLRASAAHGMTIQRISKRNLKGLTLPLPDLTTQDTVARIGSDLALLVTGLDELQSRVDKDWTSLNEVSKSIDELKAVLDIEQRIKKWYRELPYPLATIYRRYQVEKEPKERLDRLFHFFEMAAVYIAAIGTSHVRALSSDWREKFSKWFHPKGLAGIEQTTFGFWTILASTSLKELSRISSDPELRDVAEDKSGFELVEVARSLEPLRKTRGVLDDVRRCRNTLKGHGGYLKDLDAEQYVRDLQQSIRDFYDASASVFNQNLLVKTGSVDVINGVMAYQVNILVGSDPAFESGVAEVNHRVDSHTLAFWKKDADVMCKTLPFFRMGVPKRPRKTDFYVFSRIVSDGFRWISYHDADEQEFVADDCELQDLMDCLKRKDEVRS